MSVNKDQEYMSDGIAEELLNLLAQIPELRVISRTSAFYFKGKHVSWVARARPVPLSRPWVCDQQALVIAPAYADAWAGKGLIYMIQGLWGLRPYNEGFTLAREAAGQQRPFANCPWAIRRSQSH